MISKLLFSLENYELVKTEAKSVYNSLGCVKCNALGGQLVYFTAEGLNHLFYKHKSERPKQDQFMRLKVIDLVKKIIGMTTTIQEKDEKIQLFKVKMKKKSQEVSKIVKFWGFTAIIENKKITVVLRKVGEGKIHFWSVVPAWRTTKKGNIKVMEYSKSDLENI